MRHQLGIMVRVPEAGTVKTRLLPALSADDACELYRAFLGDLFERLASASGPTAGAPARPRAISKVA